MNSSRRAKRSGSVIPHRIFLLAQLDKALLFILRYIPLGDSQNARPLLTCGHSPTRVTTHRFLVVAALVNTRKSTGAAAHRLSRTRIVGASEAIGGLVRCVGDLGVIGLTTCAGARLRPLSG
jgi:hypothetical protein